MKKITDLSLKWRIYWFYLLLGFLPMLVIAYFSMQAYTRSIESITSRHVTQMVQQIAQQTDMRCWQTWQDVRSISELPFVRRFFHEFHNPLQLALAREKLNSARAQAAYVDGLALYSNQMGRLVHTKDNLPSAKIDAMVKAAVAEKRRKNMIHQVMVSPSGRWLIIITRVFAFHDAQLPAGFLVGAVPLSYVTEFLERLDISPGTSKTLYASGGQPLLTLNAPSAQMSTQTRVQTYSAGIELTDWRIAVSIPQAELFADVRRLMFRSLSFTAVLALLAGIASLVFSRRFMRPFDHVLTGTRSFASGDLDHRITIRKGIEAKRLAHAFNTMADQLNARQMELVQSNKLAALGLLSAGIAHEIKNPLAGIKTSAQVMNQLVENDRCSGPEATPVPCPGAASDDIVSLSRGIVAEADRLNRIVMQLLEFGRPSPSRRKRCRVDRILDRALSLIQKEIKRKQITVDTSLDECTATVDPDQLLQIFVNLILNAVAAVAPSTGQIAATVKEADSDIACVVIKDNGRGIAEDKLDRIFDPFFSMTPDGTGLGLSVVFTLLQQNNIKVDVESRLNHGTTFTLGLPKGRIPTEEANHG